MPVQLLNPPGIPAPDVYRQMAVATGSRTVWLAGQVARTEDGTPVGACDLAAQVEQAYLNVAVALGAVGGTFDDVAKLTLYIVDWSPEKLADLGGRRRPGGRTARPRPDQAGHAAAGEPRWRSRTCSSRSRRSPSCRSGPQATSGATSTISSRCTTSRRYSGARSPVLRPSRPGSSAAS